MIHVSVIFNSHRLRENDFIAFFICFMTLCSHVIDWVCDFVDNRLALEPTTLSSLVVIPLAEIEI